MLGAVFLGDRTIELREFPDPTPGPGEVIIAIKASGICGTDLHHYRAAGGTLPPGGPFIAGHEPAGIVVDLGPGVADAEGSAGQRVMVHHYRGCGRCKHCRVGWSQLCPHGVVVYGRTGHGAHAPLMRVPARTLVLLPEPLSFEEGAAIACGTGTAYGALKRLDVSGRDTLAIFGQGPLGLSATLLGAAMGARVVAIDPVPERLELASQLGAVALVNPRDGDPVVALRDITRGEGVEAALECSGSPEARLAAVQSASTWGRVCFVGERNPTTFDVSRDIIRKQLTILGSWTFSTVIQEECARFIVDRNLPLRQILAQRFPLSRIAEAYREFDTQTTAKETIVF